MKQIANPHSIRLILLSQIRQFLGFASPRFANPQIIHHRTERMKHLFLKGQPLFFPFMAKNLNMGRKLVQQIFLY
jgi:hypothetical protein